MISKKRTRLSHTIELIFALALFSSCNRSTSNEKQFLEADVALEQAVEEKLEATPRLRGVSYDVQVEAQDGTVTLTGETDTLKDVLLAERVAAGAQGVSKVVNHLKVRTVGPEPDTKGFNPALLREQAEANGERIGQSRQDAEIYFRLRQLLVDTSVTPKEAISIDVVDQAVTLRGMVFSEQARDLAVAVASGMPKVRAVKDDLLVNAPRPDGESRELVPKVHE